MILGYDTETSTLPDWHAPSDAPQQPSLLQLALLKHDMDGKEVDRLCTLVKPRPDCVIAKEAFEAHGITFERAMDEGIPAGEAFDAFIAFLEGVVLTVGHNESFDRRIMRITAAHHKGFKWEPTVPSFCTLWKSKFIINLPPTQKMIRAGMPGPKAPSLTECIQHFFKEELTGAHDAMVDIEGSMRVFWHLVRELNVPMFKQARTTRSPRKATSAPARAANPFEAARLALGDSK